MRVIYLPFSMHLTDDEHVPASDDALLHLGLQGLANISLVSVAVSGVNMAITSCNGGLYCALDREARKLGGLQQLKQVFNWVCNFIYCSSLTYMHCSQYRIHMV